MRGATVLDRGVPTHINSYSTWCSGLIARQGLGLGVPAAMAWGTANLAGFFPLFLPWNYFLQRFFWCNGTSATINVDVGIYEPGGQRLASTGSTAQSGASAVQYAAPSGGAIWLNPGWHYLAFVASATTAARCFGATIGTVALGRMTGLVQMASALPLPATATFAAFGAGGPNFQMFGITNTASGF